MPVGLVVLAVATAVTGGCATVPVRPAPGPEVVLPVWPEPPLPPRITFVQLLADGQSIGAAKAGLRESFVNFIAGRTPPSDHLYQPMDIAPSDDGQRVYVADFGQMSVFVGDFERKTFAPLSQPFDRPFGIGIDNAENIYVSEQDGKRITVLNRALQVVRVITHPSLIRPAGLELDRGRGRLYVADPSRQDSPDHSVKVFDLQGNLLRTLGNGRGSCDGCLLFPTFVAVDSKGNVYVSNTLNARIDVFDPEGKFLRRIGERGNSYGMFDKPKGVALDSFDNVYVVDSGWSNVQIFNQQGEVLLFFGGRGENPGLLANPTGIAIDKAESHLRGRLPELSRVGLQARRRDGSGAGLRFRRHFTHEAGCHGEGSVRVGRASRLGLSLAWVLVFTLRADGQVRGSKHDFSGKDAGSASSAPCTFCHTPHRAISSRLTWNHTLSNNAFRWSRVATAGGTTYPTIGLTWQGPSKFCLSCHDGSRAIGSVAWFNGQSWVTNPLDNDNHDGDNVQIGNRTGDLALNHPFAFPYPFAGSPSTYNGVTTAGGAVSGFRPDPTAVGIRLFKQAGADVSAGTAVGATGIECSSCHDPHNAPSSVQDDPFLRGSTDVRDSNYICRKCHLVMGDYRSNDSLHPHRPRFN